MNSCASGSAMPHLLRQAARAHAVHDAEVDDLGARAQLGSSASPVTPKMRRAVLACTSSPLWNASIRLGSPDRCAITRSSICE